MALSGGEKNVCLTMHQPWASLLVAGVKSVEGRSWKTAHRGRLWIHAAAKEPTEAEVRTVEDRYRAIYSAEGIADVTMPTSYPTSCLLGCVEVVGCMSQREFQEAKDIPTGPKLESESEFVFLCRDPRKMVLPFSLSGQHKLWKLDKRTRQAAEAGLGLANDNAGPSPVAFTADRN
ncbi:unnamed protein product [Ascophyllum nodosum]